MKSHKRKKKQPKRSKRPKVGLAEAPPCGAGGRAVGPLPGRGHAGRRAGPARAPRRPLGGLGLNVDKCSPMKPTESWFQKEQ